MKFTINPTVFATLPTLKVGVIIAKNIDQTKNTAGIAELVQTAITNAQSKAATDPNLAVWQTAFAKLGIDLQKFKPSHQALLDRVQKNQALPSIFPLVDLANATSLTHLIPVGTHTLDTLSDDIEIRYTTTSDTFVPMNSSTLEAVEPGILAYTAGNTVLTKNLVWRQGETSKVTAQTNQVFIPIDTFDTITETELLAILTKLQNQLIEFFGATVEKGIVSQANPSFSWDHSPSPTVHQLPEVLTRGVAEVLPSAQTLAELMTTKKIRLYLGIDPTGSLLTLGHSVVLRKLQEFAKLGHEVILLIGNGTVRIGDPTGRDSTRPTLTDEEINANFKDWKDQAAKILDFSKITIVHNGDWLDKLTYVDMVKLLAKTTVQQLTERDMFQDRMAKGLPIHGHEILYPMLQGYDSVAMDVDLEIGGTDQTFNMMMGRHLQRVYNNHEKWVLTTPIINGTDGRKMSKSYGNFVALTENPIDMYGKLMRISDDMISEYFTVLTDISTAEIEEMAAAMKAGANPMEFKKRLAKTITTMYHNEAEAVQAEEHFEKTIQNREVPADAAQVTISSQSISLLNLVGLLLPEESKSNLRRFIEQSAVELLPSGERPTDPNVMVDPSTITTVRVGKRRYFMLKINATVTVK